MEVEIYDQTEMGIDITGEVRQESDPEALALIEQLGLEGQQKINTSASSAGEEDPADAFRNHYQLCTAEQQMVIMEFFQKHKSVQEYDNGPIPLRVLKEVAFIKEHFGTVEVFYAPPAEIVDPIIIAHPEPEVFRWGASANRLASSFMICRWGDALAPWSDLYRDAVASRMLKMENKLKGIIGKCNAQLQRLQAGEAPEHRELVDDLPRTFSMPFGD